MSQEDVREVSQFHYDWQLNVILRKPSQWFALCRSLKCSPTVRLRLELTTNSALKDLFPNLMSALAMFVVLPTSAFGAERSFSTLRRLITYLQST